MTRIVTASFTPLAAPGPVSVPEAQVGDLVLFLIETSPTVGQSTSPQALPNNSGYAPVVIVAGEILQSTNGVVTQTYVAVLERDSGSKTISITGTIS